MNTTMTDKETLVHHTVVDLYELHDVSEVTAVTVSKHLDMPWMSVRGALVSLQSQGVLEMDCGFEQVVTRCDNLGYYPLAGKA